MKIDGRSIAAEILNNLKPQLDSLKQRGIVPTLAIILIGNDQSSESYIKQKRLRAEELGLEVKLFHLQTIEQKKLLELIRDLNQNPNIHGIIVQRPLPTGIDSKEISNAIDPEKDVDGFNPSSKFNAPVAEAVLEILKSVRESDLNNKNIVVIGKGETAGGPVVNLLNKLGANPIVIDSKTQNPSEIIKNANIIISAAGKENVVKPEYLSKNQILIGVGLFLKDGKLKGDYEESRIERRVKYYTPTIGGVGPINVSFLMKNLVTSVAK